jgi:hypothetical protein
MIPLYDHIIELRAELRGCYLPSPQERVAMNAELDRGYGNSGGG